MQTNMVCLLHANEAMVWLATARAHHHKRRAMPAHSKMMLDRFMEMVSVWLLLRAWQDLDKHQRGNKAIMFNRLSRAAIRHQLEHPSLRSVQTEHIPTVSMGLLMPVSSLVI